ncbi:hypothetical protein [Streptomyces rhizosphaerihabitans]|uniref:hypothetical protein n=1 Tax=Streptomyces rhizosphaerihabitans TaxID=1266770 RepID=UPI0021C12552|nr:hypothetical protein [Streptomyces rhizosphaerihabitans]MCT9005233.1 hypothetical protein [Streptomyces rhizosphaerihabitans]
MPRMPRTSRMKSRARWTAVAAAATAAICLTGSAAASSNPSPGGKPTTSASVDGAKSAKARAVAAAKAAGKANGKGKPVEDQARLVEAFAKGIAARLGVSPASARQAVKELFALADRHDGVDPRSPEFAAIAKRLGVTPGQFEKALSATKQAIGKQQGPGKPGEGKGRDKGKPGRDKPVIKHQGPDDPADMRSVALGVAHRLGVSTSAAERAVKELFALSDRPGGVDAGSTEFAAIAKRLGVTPGQFEKALSATKQATIAEEQSLKG